MTREETKNLLQTCSSFQSCESSYTCPHAPLLYGDEGTFTFRQYPWTQRIFLVWTHTQISFTSHTFTSLPLVHTLNPDFLRWQLWLCFLLVRECSRSGNLHASCFLNSSSIIFPNFVDSRSSWLRRFMALSLHEFATSGCSRFKILSHRAFVTPRLREFGSPVHRAFAISRLCEFQTPDLHEFFAPENLHHKFH
jgi:hypothetical protein